jgi:hypothetical protein
MISVTFRVADKLGVMRATSPGPHTLRTGIGTAQMIA